MRPLITTTSMSKDHHSLQLAIEDSRNQYICGDMYRKSSQSDYDSYLTHSSSPARSSSPPSTPLSSRRDSGYAYVRSSPDVPVDALYRQRAVDIRARYPLSSRPLFSSIGTSVCDYHDVSNHAFHTDVYNQISDFDGRKDDITSDSDDDMDISIDGNSYRTTFFRVSAERGLWRNDSIPLKTTLSTLQERKSVPTFSRVPTPLPLTSRTVSEPAPSNISQMAEFYLENQRSTELPDTAVAITGVQHTLITSSFHSKPDDEISSPNTFPSLIEDAEGSDGDVNIELDAHAVPSSPLPPSSPPLSPLSRSISIISRSSSPLSFDFTGSSSPLSELPDDYDIESHVWDEEDFLNSVLGTQTIPPSLKVEGNLKESELVSELQISCRDSTQKEMDSSPSKLQLSALPCSEDPTLSPVSTLSTTGVASLSREEFVPIDAKDSALGATSSSSLRDVLDANATDGPDAEITSNLIVHPVTSIERADDDSSNRCLSQNLEKSSTLKDRNGVRRRSSTALQPSTSRSSSQKAGEQREAQKSAGRTKKQSDGERGRQNSSKVKGKKMDTRKRTDRDDEEDVENDGSTAGSRRKRLKRMDGDARSTKRMQKPRRRPSSEHHEDEVDEPLDTETRELRSTICGLVIETMATSRASSLPASSIFKLVMNSQPYLKSQRSEQDWLRVFERVLRDGAADRGSGVFGKVESSGKDESDRPLEAQWFYVPDRDEDQERAALIRSMMPRPGKRTETMKYKQYYWRPLGRCSKWDPEDAL